MEFLKEILGEELFNQVSAKVNEYNDNEANKDKQIRIANINTGEYVSKMKYDDITGQLTGKQAELETANGLIAELKKASKGNDDMQGKITAYETEITKLQEQLKETKVKSAVKTALLSEKAVDVDYLTYKLNEKLKEKGETLELDENDNIKGWTDKLSGLKTQFPTMFESASTGKDGYQVLGDNRLPEGDGNTKTEPKNLAEALRMQYENNN